MSKVLAKTTGQFMLMNSDMTPIYNHRPTVTAKTNFLSERVYENQVEIVNDKVPDEATDEGFETVIKAMQGAEGSEVDYDVAFAAYVSELKDKPEQPSTEAPVVKSGPDSQLAKDEQAEAAKKEADEKAKAAEAAKKELEKVQKTFDALKKKKDDGKTLSADEQKHFDAAEAKIKELQAQIAA